MLFGNYRAMATVNAKQSRRSLKFRDAIRLRSAQIWLALGIVEEAERELRMLKRSASLHPEALKVFQQLQRAWAGCWS